MRQRERTDWKITINRVNKWSNSLLCLALLDVCVMFLLTKGRFIIYERPEKIFKQNNKKLRQTKIRKKKLAKKSIKSDS